MSHVYPSHSKRRLLPRQSRFARVWPAPPLGVWLDVLLCEQGGFPGGPLGWSLIWLALDCPDVKCNTPGKMTYDLHLGSLAHPGLLSEAVSQWGLCEAFCGTTSKVKSVPLALIGSLEAHSMFTCRTTLENTLGWILPHCLREVLVFVRPHRQCRGRTQAWRISGRRWQRQRSNLMKYYHYYYYY